VLTEVAFLTCRGENSRRHLQSTWRTCVNVHSYVLAYTVGYS